MANIIITGANRGLGLQFVKELSKFVKKTNIFALCRDPSKAEELNNIATKQNNITVIKADLTDFDKYNDIVNDIRHHLKDGGINLLINNAGVLFRDTLETVTVENIVNSYEINSIAPLMFTKALIPLLKKADREHSLGQIGSTQVWNISALLGSIEETTTPGYLSYRLSKVSLNMVTKALAIELKPIDVFVIALHPGWVKTDMGGPDAPVTIEESIAGTLKTALNAEEQTRGCLLDYNGRIIPW